MTATTVTTTITDTTDDGESVYQDSFVYAPAHDAAAGTGSSTITNTVGQRFVTLRYSIYRCFLKFDTSAIPANAKIVNATLKLYGNRNYSDIDFVVRVQKWVTTDGVVDVKAYDEFDGVNYDDGNLNTSTFTTTGYNTIVLSNFDCITRAGITYLCIRSKEDVDDSAPNGREYVVFAEAAVDKYPTLTVTYTQLEWICCPFCGGVAGLRRLGPMGTLRKAEKIDHIKLDHSYTVKCDDCGRTFKTDGATIWETFGRDSPQNVPH